jgi:RNA polymerase sigma factor (sigma-70 family)
MRSFEGWSDEQLLHDEGRGGETYALFYRRYESAVLRYFMRRVSGAELAMDLTAETFAAALTSRKRHDPARGPAAAWLFGIARHILSRSVRQGQVEDRARQRLGLDPLVLRPEAITEVDGLIDSPASDFLEHLPSDQRAAVWARVIDEDSYAEIATTLNCSESVIRKRVSRGLATLRNRLEPE